MQNYGPRGAYDPYKDRTKSLWKSKKYVEKRRTKKKVKKVKPVHKKKHQPVQYAVYIRSAAWAAKRRALKARMKKVGLFYVCYTCGSSVPIHVHHITYARLGRERFKDLVVLCYSCHSDLHDIQVFQKVSCLEATRLFFAEQGRNLEEYQKLVGKHK